MMGKKVNYRGAPENRPRKFDPLTGLYRYYDYRTNKHGGVDLPTLKLLGESLPADCKVIVDAMDANPAHRMNKAEQDKMMLLLSYSIGIWGGGMNGRLSDVHATDYSHSFYIRMVGYLRRFDRSKGCWVARCRWIGLDTVNKDYKIPFGKVREVDKAIDNAWEDLKIMYPELAEEETKHETND